MFETERSYSWEQLPIDIQYLDWHIICRSTYCMSINIHTMYVDQHNVCQLTYCMWIEIHQGMYADRDRDMDRDTSRHVCRSTYCMLIDIQYLDRHTWCVCWSTYCMSILYVSRDTVCRSAVVPICRMQGVFCSNVWNSTLVCRVSSILMFETVRSYTGYLLF